LESGHNVPVIRDGIPLGSQESRDILAPVVERVVVPPGIRRGCAPRSRRGRGRANLATRPIDSSDSLPEFSHQHVRRGRRGSRGRRGGAAESTGGRRGRSGGHGGIDAKAPVWRTNSTASRGVANSTTVVAPTRVPDGWIPPAILPNIRSPFFLHRRRPTLVPQTT
jgi:hypothetical protein